MKTRSEWQQAVCSCLSVIAATGIVEILLVEQAVSATSLRNSLELTETLPASEVTINTTDISVTKQLIAQLDDAYTLGAGDTISIEIFNVPEYSGAQQVLADGSVNLPVVGRVQVSGLTGSRLI